MPHYLLTALGTTLRETRYALHGKEATASAAPLALLELLPVEVRPEEVVVVLTAGSRQKAWDAFREAFEERWKDSGVRLADPIDVPDGSTEEEIREILETVAERFREPCELTIDVTHGYRHFPFILYPLVLYLTSLRHIELKGAYYGMLESAEPAGPKPIVDLRVLLELPEWFYVVRLFREHGFADGLARQLDALSEEIKNRLKQTDRSSRIGDVLKGVGEAIKPLRIFSFAYGSALPLELGRAARSAGDKLAKTPHQEFRARIPLASALLNLVTASAEVVALPSGLPAKGKWKTTVGLDREELERQARLIEQYLERKQFSLAVGLLREWVVSWVLLARGEGQQWLKRNARANAGRYLGMLASLSKNKGGVGPIDERLLALGRFWQRLAELRNQFAHNGMCEEEVTPEGMAIEVLKTEWNKLRGESLDLPELGGGGGALLVSPQGQRKGVLYSAIRTAIKLGGEIRRCLVVCSQQSVATLDEAAKAAGFEGEVHPLVLKDPFAGFDEINGLVQQAFDHILASDAVFANLTGGTTLMGIVVQAIVEKADQFARPVRRFALIDRRSVAEQDQDPYVESEYFLLPGAEEREESSA